MSTTTSPATADDLLRIPDDGYRYELIRGEIVRMPPTGQQHGHIASTLLVSLGQHVRAQGLGRTYAAQTWFLHGSCRWWTSLPDTRANL
jgi:Uma2 family endonuclease